MVKIIEISGFSGKKYQIFDHNKLSEKIVVANYVSPDKNSIDDAIKIAQNNNEWRFLSDEKRIEIIKKLSGILVFHLIFHIFDGIRMI